MSTDTPAAGGETKIKNEDNKVHSGRNNNRRNNNNNFNKTVKFVGAHPSLQGHVFETKRNRSEQVTNYNKVDEIIKAQIGVTSDPYVLESLEKDAITLPSEPAPVYVQDKDGKDTKEIDEIEMIKFKSKYNKYLSQVDTIQKQTKQAFSIYYGQISEEMKASLKEDPNHEKSFQEKNVLALRKMLKNVNFDYKKTQEPFKTLVMATKDMMLLKQNDDTLQEYNTKFEGLKKVVDEIYHSEYGSPYIDIICRETGQDPEKIKKSEKKAMIKEGDERMQAMTLILNADKNRYENLWKEYDRAYLNIVNGAHVNRYPKTCNEAYTLLKNWNRFPDKIVPKRTIPGTSFNTLGNEVGGGKGGKPKCPRCGRDNHKLDDCFARKHMDGTVLHVEDGEVNHTMGSLEEEIDPEVSTKFTGPHPACGPGDVIDFYCGNELEELMFLQPDMNGNSPTEKSNTRSKAGISESWILLDSQSTIDVFSNPDMLTRVHRINTTLRIRCNAGTKTTDYRGYLSGYGWVWYYPQGIANILSLSRVKEKYRVTFDSALDNCFHVHKDNGKILTFKEASRRLYYFDTKDKEETETLLITTVEGNKNKLSARDVIQATRARKLQRTIGRASTADYIRYVANNAIPDCPITVQDIKNAEFIWGRELGCLKGKTVRSSSPQVRLETTSIPVQIMQQYQNVTLSVDIMKVAGIPFLTTISKHIQFGSAGKLDNMQNSHMLKHFKAIIGAYVARGFKVTIILADNQFESMRGDIANLGALLSITARDEHVPEVERYHQTLKGRIRGNYTLLPFKHIPPIFIIEMVYNAVFWRNMFALKGGISKTQSPSELVLGRKLNYNSHCRIEFGEYAQTHEESSNDMKERTLGAIATRPSNDSGAYYFISLRTGRRINRRSWTPLPMPETVIDQIHRLARRAKASKEITFTDINNIDFDDLYAAEDDDDAEVNHNNDNSAGVDDDDSDDDDANYNPDSDSDNYYSALDDDDDDDDDEDDNDDDDDDAGADNDIETPGVVNEDDNEETPGVGNNDESNEIPGVDDESESGDNPGVVENDEIPGVDDHQDTAESQTTDNADEEDQETQRGTGTMNLRRQHRKVYNIRELEKREKANNEQVMMLQFQADDFDIVETTVDKEEAEDEAEYMFLTETLGWKEGLDNAELESAESSNDTNKNATKLAEYLFLTEQMGWRKGLTIFKEKGELAIGKELQQIHDMEGFQPKHWHELTEEQRKKALKYLMYLKEKRDGKIKGRGCADGRSQRLYTTKIESSSPTASLAGLMLSCMIDAYEERDVATVDIPGAFLQTKMPDDEEDVHVVLDGRMAELLAKISPETYQKYVHHRRGQAYIYCKCNVAIYGTLKAALLFWKKLSASLIKRGFIINPYDWCVANKNINGKQCTIVWHVDDLKISHVDSKVVDGIIASLNAEYGQVGEMTVRRGKIHDYLGMKLDFSKPKKFMIDMEEMIDEILSDVPEDMNGMATTPAADHLFKVRDNVQKLSEDRADFFHRKTAQILFVSHRGRPDFRTAMSFLTKRVQTPDEDDYKKLARLVKYMRKTKWLRLTIEATYLDQNHWFIDGAFAVHPDMKSHNGAYMTFGKGMIDGSSKGQKINTTSSTEAEVVAVHDSMPTILWTRYFLEAQGYPLKSSILHQDNLSSKQLETNGRGSSSKRTRHMNIRYFFVADVISRKHLTIEYCPTDEMIGDFFTKPVGGAKFRRFRNIIMNITHDEHGPVDVDELMAIHNAKMQKRFDEVTTQEKQKSESHISSEVSTDANSQECVGIGSTRSNATWAAIRGAHKNKPTYAQVVVKPVTDRDPHQRDSGFSSTNQIDVVNE